MPDAESTPTGTPFTAPVPSPPDDVRRQAFLLHLLANAPERRLPRGELNKKLRTKAAAAVGLAPEAVSSLLDRCSSGGYLRVETAPRLVAYTLTDAGAAQLDTMRSLLPEVKQPGSRRQDYPALQRPGAR